MTSYFRYAVCIFDNAHTFANGILYGYQSSIWSPVKTWFKESRSLFTNSLTRRANFKGYVRRKNVANDTRIRKYYQ